MTNEDKSAIAEAFDQIGTRFKRLAVLFENLDVTPEPVKPAPEPTPEPITPKPEPVTPAPVVPTPPSTDIFVRQGYAADIAGGTGGKVYQVKTYADYKAALAATSPKIIRQVVDTPIELPERVTYRGKDTTFENLFLSAKADTHTLELAGSNIIVTGSRLYNPTTFQRDVVTIPAGAHDVLIEFSTLLFGADESFNSWNSWNINLAWCVIAYPLDHAAHGYGPLFGDSDRGGKNVTLHHCLLHTIRYRAPLVKLQGGYQQINNVIYNCGADSATLIREGGADTFKAVVLDNVYKHGPNSNQGITDIRIEPAGLVQVEGNVRITSQGLLPAKVSHGATVAKTTPTGLPEIKYRTTASQAYEDVLNHAGGPRDKTLLGIIDHVRKGTSPVSGRWVHSPADVGL